MRSGIGFMAVFWLLGMGMLGQQGQEARGRLALEPRRSRLASDSSVALMVDGLMGAPTPRSSTTFESPSSGCADRSTQEESSLVLRQR